MRQIKVTILRPNLGPNKIIQHALTTYEVAKSMDFENDVVLRGQLDSSKLSTEEQSETIYLTIEHEDVHQDTPLFFRCKHHFQRIGTQTVLEGEWSRILAVAPRDSNFSVSNQIVFTPKVDVEEEEDVLNVTTSDFLMYSGAGGHASTTYNVTDSNNISAFYREKEPVSKQAITVAKDKLQLGKIWQVKAKHHNSFNTTSLYGNSLYIKYIPYLELYDFETIGELIYGRKLYYRLKIYTINFSSYDLQLRDVKGNVVMHYKEYTNCVGTILPEGLQAGGVYEIFIKINYITGDSTEYSKVYSSILLNNRHYPKKTGVEYIEMYNKESDVFHNGNTCVTLRQLFTGEIIGPDYFANEICLYRQVNGTLVKYKTLHKFDGKLGLDYFNMVQAPTGDIIVDVLRYNDQGQLIPVFFKFEYNPIKQVLVLLGELERPRELYTTSICCSMIITEGMELVYVPAYYTDGYSTERQKLPIIVIDINTMEVRQTVEHPDPVKAAVTLVYDHNGQIYVIGGSYHNRYSETGNKEEYFLRDVNNIYTFNTGNQRFTRVSTIPADWPKGCWALQPFLRLDNNIVLFNGSPTGPNIQTQDVLIFNTISKECTIQNIDHRWNVPFRNNIYFLNGNIKRISSTAIDPQKAVMYISNTIHRDNVVGVDSAYQESSNLVIEDGKVVAIEDIYKYRNIVIRGDGVLLWYRPQGITEITAEDLIINRVRTVGANALANNKYRNLIILDGTDFHIQN